VARSRWKRLVREAFRLSRERIGNGWDVVVVPKVGPTGIKRADVERSLVALLKRIRRRSR
jgi:ribonuclease P protein component